MSVCGVEQALEHRVLPADLLEAVHLESVLDVPVALVLAGQVTGIATLDEHRDDLVVGNGVLDALVGHLVELGLDVVDVRHEVEHVARIVPGVMRCLPGHSGLDRPAAHVVDGVHQAVHVAVRVIGRDDQVEQVLAATLPAGVVGDDPGEALHVGAHVRHETRGPGTGDGP